jgi:hypothetical protein
VALEDLADSSVKSFICHSVSELYLMLRDARYILKGGFILCCAYESAASIPLRLSAVDVSLAIFLIQFYMCVRKQVDTD